MIVGYLVPCAVNQLRYISLEVGDVIISLRRSRAAGVGQGVWDLLGVVGEVQHFRGDRSILCGFGNGFPEQSAASVEIAVFLRNRRHQNPLVDTTGAAGFLQAVFGDGRLRVNGDGDNGGLVGGTTAAAAVVDVLDVLPGFYIVMTQFGYGVVLVTVTTGAFVEGVAVFGASGGYHGCGIAVGMVGAGSAAAGADVYHGCIGCGFLVIVAQGGGFVCLVAVPAGAFVEGIALLSTGGCHHSGLIVVFLHPFIGLAGDLLLCLR